MPAEHYNIALSWCAILLIRAIWIGLFSFFILFRSAHVELGIICALHCNFSSNTLSHASECWLFVFVCIRTFIWVVLYILSETSMSEITLIACGVSYNNKQNDGLCLSISDKRPLFWYFFFISFVYRKRINEHFEHMAPNMYLCDVATGSCEI